MGNYDNKMSLNDQILFKVYITRKNKTKTIINNVFYKCYKNDIHYSCNGYGLKNDLYNLNNSKNNNFSVSCPKSWIKTPYSGWMVTVPTKLVSESASPTPLQ